MLAEHFPAPPRHLLARGLAADPRVRAHDGGDPERLRAAARGPATWRSSSGSSAGRACGFPLYITKSNGGVTTARDARQATAETMLSGPASGVIGRRLRLRPRRVPRPDHLRHGRHQRGHRPRERRPARVLDRRDGGRLPDRHAGRRHVVDRRGRRLDRLARRRRRAEGRAAERGRRSRARLLRPRRHRAGALRRLPPVRVPQPRQLRRRPAPAPSRQAAAGHAAARRGARPRRGRRPPRRWSRSPPRTCTRRSRTCWPGTASTRATSPSWPSAAPAPSRPASSPRSSTSRASSCRRRPARSAPRAR